MLTLQGFKSGENTKNDIIDLKIKMVLLDGYRKGMLSVSIVRS